MARVSVNVSFETDNPDRLADTIKGWNLPEGALVNASFMPAPGVAGTVTADGEIEAPALLRPPEA